MLLKVLREDLRSDGPARARLEMEARSASELRALEGIVSVLDFGGDGEGGLYYALEALDGESLATLLAAGQSFSERETARLGAHLAQTLAAAKELGHGHHDLCPENVFMQRNADSALKLGQARGAAICAGYQAGLEIAEYAPREIKQALVGSGAATKEQVQYMVKRLLGLQKTLQADEGDGLAIAICHAQFYATKQKTGIDAKILKRRRSKRR